MTTTRGRADWREVGACAQADPDLFFPISSTGRALGQIAKAKAICAACPVRQPCLDFALEHDLAHGICAAGAEVRIRDVLRASSLLKVSLVRVALRVLPG